MKDTIQTENTKESRESIARAINEKSRSPRTRSQNVERRKRIND